jgi:hypothetical protein
MALRKGVYAAKAGRDNRSRIKGRNTLCMIAINEEEVHTLQHLFLQIVSYQFYVTSERDKNSAEFKNHNFTCPQIADS